MSWAWSPSTKYAAGNALMMLAWSAQNLMQRMHREAIRLTSSQQHMGMYTNLGALLMGSGQIDGCLAALNRAIALAHQYQQTDSYLVHLTGSRACHYEHVP